MKIILTEGQTKRLTSILLKEQSGGSMDTLINFFRKLSGNEKNTDINQSFNPDSTNVNTSKIDIGNSSNLNDLAKIVIDKLEGGYYHPQMLKDGRVRDSRYRRSGETMFGLDRLNGGSLNTSSAGRQFWKLIDDADAKNTWKWNYGGGELRPQLLQLASQMIIPRYNEFFKRYLSPQAQQLVSKDKRLTFNFLYATWEGSGWFSKFARRINEAVKQGKVHPDELSKVAIDARTQTNNSLIAQKTNKISNIMNNLA